MRNWGSWFYLLTDEQTHRPEIRARLFKMQDGRCAMCGEADPKIGDHDHETGFVRGLLCGRCNRLAWYGATDPAALAYIADPPAAGLNWLWDLPNWWEPSDTKACQAESVTVTAYILARPGEAERRAEAASAAAGAVLAAIELPVITEPEPAPEVEAEPEPEPEPERQPARARTRRMPRAVLTDEQVSEALANAILPPLPTPEPRKRVRRKAA